MKQPSKQNKLTRVSRKIESLKSKLSNPDTASSKVNALSAELKANKKKLKNLRGAGAGIVTYTGQIKMKTRGIRTSMDPMNCLLKT